ncbi:GNAT family N-acetyltransferase [Metabacillus sp. RGM 3146]|uniref:GNAT family N-acetyltransferase n=1 Tax=Metabacillus sp. RGM 3146 TaxID=3401092 RepID=UPI003B9BADA3
MEILTERLKLLPVPNKPLQLVSDYELGDHVKNYLRDVAANNAIIGWGVWAIIRREDDHMIGDLGFKGKPNLDGSVEIGYGLAPSVRNNGYATEAAKALMEWAFATGKVHKVIAQCLKENAASIKVLKKLGMMQTHSDEEMIYWERNRYLNDR